RFHCRSVFWEVAIRRREMTGEKVRGSVRKAMPVKSAVVVKTLRRPLTSAPPKVLSKKAFWPTSQRMISRAAESPVRHCGSGATDGFSEGNEFIGDSGCD